MDIEIKDLLSGMVSLAGPNTRVGWPDEPAIVAVSNPIDFVKALDGMMVEFRRLRPGTPTIVDVHTNSFRKSVWIRVNQVEITKLGSGQVEPELQASVETLGGETERSGGVISYWGGDNYFDVHLPYVGSLPLRDDDISTVEAFPSDEGFRQFLAEGSWDSLRWWAFRDSKIASTLAERCVQQGFSRALLPSVGLRVFPWLLASKGLMVTAFDPTENGLAPVANPARFPQIYSRTGFERWDISMTASHASVPHPESFEGMPAIEEEDIRAALQVCIAFSRADLDCLPVPKASTDLVFAHYALPPILSEKWESHLDEWIRVTRKGGIIFISQHNLSGAKRLSSYFRDRGWSECDVLNGEVPQSDAAGGFQLMFNSG